MGHSRTEKAESRDRILDAAARQIREGGLDSVRISDIMTAANLTHGGFYGHFPSRASLIAAALDRAVESGAADFAASGQIKVKAVVNKYLNVEHRDNLGDACPIGALVSEVGRTHDDDVRASLVRALEQGFENMADAMGGGPEAEETAMTIWCTMVGAINISRVFRGTDRSEQILQLARRLVLDLEARAQDNAAPALPNGDNQNRSEQILQLAHRLVQELGASMQDSEAPKLPNNNK